MFRRLILLLAALLFLASFVTLLCSDFNDATAGMFPLSATVQGIFVGLLALSMVAMVACGNHKRGE